jgi:hypothetical protein
VPLGTFIAGRYSSTLTLPEGSPLDMGLTVEGYRLTWRIHRQKISRSDAYGDSTIDGVCRGADVYISGRCLEYKTGPIKANTMHLTFDVTGAQSFGMPLAGLLDSQLACTFILTATGGTPAAAAASPTSLTAAAAIMAADFDADITFDSMNREVPFKLQLLPYSSTGIKFFTTT